MGGARGPDRGLTDGEMRERIAELRAGVDATAAVEPFHSPKQPFGHSSPGMEGA